MLLLLTIALVLVGAVALIIGFIQDSLVPIYISIGCSLLAAGVLVAFSRMTRRRPPRVVELPPEESTFAPTEEAAATEGVSTEAITILSPEEVAAAGVAEPASEAISGAPESDRFPIAGYEDLKVAEVLPRLSQLGPDELREVRRAERSGKSRDTIVKRIDALLGSEPAAARTSRAGAGRSTTAAKRTAKSTAAKAGAAKRTAKATTKSSAAKSTAATKRTAKSVATKASAPTKRAATTKSTTATKRTAKTTATKAAATKRSAKATGAKKAATRRR